MKKLIFDVKYHEDTGIARAAAVEFVEFSDAVESASYVQDSPIASEYIPGEFYKRELPAIMALLEKQIGMDRLKADYDTIVVDGLYRLGVDHPGLGMRLEQCLTSLGLDIEVIGIAKTHFNECESVSFLAYRGTSTKPLYVNGSRGTDYGKLVESMSGEYRLPYLVKAVDKLCRM